MARYIIAPDADIRHWANHPALLADLRCARARCAAKLGRMEEAEHDFKSALEVARRTKLWFVELCVHRDYIVHVLDPADRRDEYMPELGRCIRQLVMTPSSYTPLLGYGIDAEAAVTAAE